MTLYEFKPEDAERFVAAIGARAKRSNGQLNITCPYCKGGKKDLYTFYISLRTGQFECKRASCGMKGNMITLSRDFSNLFELSADVSRYYNVDNFNDKFKKFRDAHRKIESKDKAIEYCESRGISAETVRKYELTVKDESTLVFPFKNPDGELTFIKYRNIEYIKGETQGAKEWCESNCMPILFGMNLCNTENKTLIITEGQMDSLSVAEAGFENAVSVPTGANGFTWVPHCWDWITQFEKIIVFGDYEKGKITLSEELIKRFGKKVFTVRKDSYLDCKDANEILQKYGKKAIVEAIENAEPQKSELLKKTSGVQKVDIENTECIKTNFVNIDRLLAGGFHLGQLVILTGKRGDGKSTLMSQFLVEAISQGYACMVYSGELVDFYFKAWIDRQILGKNNLQQSEVDMVNRWYDDKLYLFDNNALLDSDKYKSETDAILEAIDEAIIQYNVKFICIDNLMTAIELDPRVSTYDLQSIFVGKLYAICKKHNVVIMLVAHPRKDNYGDDNDSVAGSSHITDKADIVMKYQRPKAEKGVDPSSQPPRQLAITKNRLTGKITAEHPIGMYYDEPSKRISEKANGFDQNYIESSFKQFSFENEEENPFDE